MASTEDVELLQENMEKLYKSTRTSVKQILALEDNFHTYMRVNNEHAEHVNRMLQRVVTDIHLTQSSVHDLIRVTFQFMSIITEYVDSIAAISELEENVQIINQGNLPQKWVSPQLLNTVIRNIQQTLHSSSIPLHLIYQHPADIYAYKQFTVTRQKNALYITLDFPLSSV